MPAHPKPRPKLEGKKMERLTVVRYAGRDGHHHMWFCTCRCGGTTTTRSVAGTSLRAKSCGCLSREKASKWLKYYATSAAHKGTGNPMYKHGETHSHLYRIFTGILGRCRTKSSGSYKNYGAVGISCEWSSYEDFKRDMGRSYRAHVARHGERQTTIDRKDPTKNYSKRNCRWATYAVQARNRRPRGFASS